MLKSKDEKGAYPSGELNMYRAELSPERSLEINLKGESTT